MKYNQKNYAVIIKEYEQRLAKEKNDAQKRINELYALYPDFAAIDKALMQTSIKVMSEIMKGKDGIDERIAKLKKENLELQEARAEFLRQKGYPEDYTEIRYSCRNCRDTGFCGTEICDCLKKELVMKGYESSGMLNLLKTQSFQNFDLNYYRGNEKCYSTMRHTYEYCLDYAEHFPNTDHANLLFIGDTGLGKTHMTTSIAKMIIENGYDVVYCTAQGLFADFEFERFGNSSYGNDMEYGERETAKYFNCDLLIIDDLGTEVTNQFTTACLYNVLNTRLSKGKSVIINTNLQKADIRKRYSDRIASRLFGEFIPIMFMGSDVRLAKITKK